MDAVPRLFVFGSLLIIMFCVTTATADDSAAAKLPLWRDATQPLDRRVHDLRGANDALAEKAQLQVCNIAPAIPRIGLPAYNYWNESLHGVGRNGRATVLPQGHWHGRQF